jgi:L-asparaginase/Glu-tRNA(Gln) amidotransferase subunit D
VVIAVVAPVAAQSAAAAALPTVWVLSTGGTIAGTGSSPTDLSNYEAGTLADDPAVAGVVVTHAASSRWWA